MPVQLTNRDYLIIGLKARGWRDHNGNTRNQAFRHPEKGERTLWVTDRGALRVGSTDFKHADLVNEKFVSTTIAIGQHLERKYAL